MSGKPTETATPDCPVCQPAMTALDAAEAPAGTALDAECRRIGEARAAGLITGAEAGWMAALACLLHDLGVVTP